MRWEILWKGWLKAMPTKSEIESHFEYPPIPIRNFDWVTHIVGAEPGDIFGWGRTKDDSIADFWEQWEEKHAD